MKATLVLSALLVILSTALVFGLTSSGSGSGSSNTPKICVLSNCNYFSNSSVCARYGGSNLCKRFKNSCLQRYEACTSSVTYTSVALSSCSGIPVGSRRQCADSSTSSSSSNVQAIYISRRRG